MTVGQQVRLARSARWVLQHLSTASSGGPANWRTRLAEADQQKIHQWVADTLEGWKMRGLYVKRLREDEKKRQLKAAEAKLKELIPLEEAALDVILGLPGTGAGTGWQLQ